MSIELSSYEGADTAKVSMDEDSPASSSNYNNKTKDSAASTLLNVALIGSSGGGIATVGHTDANTLLHTIHWHLTCMNARLVRVIYISLLNGKSMDAVQPATDRASLTVVTSSLYNHDDDKNNKNNNNRIHQLQVETLATDTLEHINQIHAQPLARQLAADIRNGSIQALICISMHVRLCLPILEAAIDQNLPVTGSGGTSLAQAAAMGVRMAGNVGGSVATTTQTRALSYTYSLAIAMKRSHMYKPWQGPTQRDQQAQGTAGGPNWTSVLNAALPAFWAVALTRWVLQQIGKEGSLKIAGRIWATALRWLPTYWWGIPNHVTTATTSTAIVNELVLMQSALDHFLLPAVCAILMANASATASNSSSIIVTPGSSSLMTTSTTSTASLIMASTVASFGCRDSVLAGLVAGYAIERLMEQWVMIPCIFFNVPATMTTLLGAGGLGSAVGLCCALVIAPLARCLTATIRYFIYWTLVDSALTVSVHVPVMAAFLWGCLSCASSKVGYYHAVHLPLILIELETTNTTTVSGSGSFLGAVDELTLVMVCAGVCAAKVLLQSSTTTDRAICRRGLWINLLSGDFVEVCYPYMEQSLLINVSGYLASGLSCAVLVLDSKAAISEESAAATVPGSLAYLPWVASVVLAGDHWYAMLRASIVSFAIPFWATLIAGKMKTTRTTTTNAQTIQTNKKD